MSQTALTLLFVAAVGQGDLAQAQAVHEEDVRDYDESTGIGCVSKKPITERAEYYFVCKSKRSGESAWNAALYRGKLACNGNIFYVFFNLPASSPVEDAIYGAQVEFRCDNNPNQRL